MALMTRGMFVVGLAMLVVEDINWLPHTVIKKGETVTVDLLDEWFAWLRPSKYHGGLSRWDGAFSVDWWDEDMLDKLQPIE